MIGPFENDTRRLTAHLASRYAKADKRSNLLLIITIALSVCMVLSVALISAGLEQQLKDRHRDKAQITVLGATDEQLDKLRQDEKVKWIGQYSLLGVSYQDDIKLIVKYADSNYLRCQQQFSVDGQVPGNDREIMITAGYAQHLGRPYAVGDEITVDVTGLGGEQIYVISGILHDGGNNKSKAYDIYVSRTQAQRLADSAYNGILQITAYTRLDTAAIYSEDILNMAYGVVSPYDIESNQVFITSYSGYMTGVIRAHLPIPINLIALITAALAGMMVYGIFSTMIARNVQSIGQLRMIGMTQRQVKRMVRRQGFQFAAKGIPVGVLCGLLFSFMVCPDGFKIDTAVKFAVLAVIMSAFTLALAIFKPVRIAMHISPTEGSRYIAYQGGVKAGRKLHRKLTPLNLARINISRNRKKAVFTFLALGISGGILLATATVAGSIDARKQAAFQYFPEGDIQLQLQNFARSTFDGNNEYNYSTKLQAEDNPLERSEVLAEILALDGIEKLTPHNAIYMTVTFDAGLGSVMSIGNYAPTMTRAEYERVSQVIANNPGYDDMTAQNGIFAAGGVAKVGDVLSLNLRGPDGNKRTVEAPVLGVFDGTELMETCPLVPGNPRFLITYDTVRELTGAEAQTGVLSVKVEAGKYESVLSALNVLADNSDEIDCRDISQTAASIEQYYSYTIQNLYLIAVILFIFGGVSLVNTLVVDFRNRKREFGLLAVVGATRNQLKKMLHSEIAIYLTGSLFIAIAGSLAGGAIACYKLDNANHCISYQYPWLFTVGLIALLVVIWSVFAAYSSKELKNTAVLEAVKAQ